MSKSFSILRKGEKQRRFQLGKIHHHETLMLEVLQMIAIEEAVHLFGHASTGSRLYLVKYYKAVINLLLPSRRVLSNLECQSREEFEALCKKKHAFTVAVVGPP